MKTFIDYYRVLKVGPEASAEIIRTAFRRLAKKYHPDISDLDPERAARRMRLLIEAYRILMDAARRTAYDLRRKKVQPGHNLSFVDSLRRRPRDPFSRALLIFFDLLNGEIGRALANYERMQAEATGEIDLLALLGAADFLDCTFLLGEGYQQKGRYREAVVHYETAWRQDQKLNYFRNFRPELKQRIRDIYCRKLARTAPPAEAIGYYRRLLDEYEFPKYDRAFLHKKIAECYGELGETNRARQHFQTALELKPNLSGTKKIRSYLDDTSQ